MSGTTVIYNGVIMRDCETKSFSQKIIYDDSKTDVIYSLFRIRVTSTLVAYIDSEQRDHPSTITTGSTLNAGSTPVQLERISRLLNEKGKLFYFYIHDAPSPPAAIGNPDMILVAIGPRPDGTVILLDPENVEAGTMDAGAVIDVANGPKPQDVRVEQIYGGRTMRVTFEIEIARKLCPPGFIDEYPEDEPLDVIKPTVNVLNNRWHISESKDANWVTTRILQGTLRVTSKKVLPHLQRYLVVPSLQNGYQRTLQHFASDPTDLVLKYRIEDRRRHEAPPAPAIDWNGEYVESCGKHGLNQMAELRIKLIGPPGVDKQDLIGAAGRVAKQRFVGLQKKQADLPTFEGILEGSSIVDVIGEPIIEMRIRFRFAEQPDANENALSLRLKRIGEPLAIDGYHPDEWPSPLPYDNMSPAGVLACYLQHPCSVWHGVPFYPYGTLAASEQSRSTYAESDRDGYDKDVRYYPAQKPFTIDESKIEYDEHFAGYPYTLIDVRTRYHNTTGFAQLPLAKVVSENADTCRIVRLHSGLCQRVFMMEASRVGRPPVIPIPLEQLTDANGIKETLLNSSIELHAPEFKADSFSREYRILAEYVYALSRPPRETEKLRMAVSPIDTIDAEDRYISAEDLYSSTKII